MKSEKYFIAIDLGAESGRIIVGILKNKRLNIEEIHRFPTKQLVPDNTIFWDINFIFNEIKRGIQLASELGYNSPSGIGVDSWGVDFALLDENDALIENPIAYRDSRTDGMMEKVFEIIPKESIYKTCGIQFLKFNTIYQLYSLVQSRERLLQKAKSLLMIPDYINFLFTGKKYNEYTNATTTSMLNAKTCTSENKLLELLEIPTGIMQKIIYPTFNIGEVKKGLKKELGLKNGNIYAVGSHDTASAIVAVPSEGKNWAYLSSGTWSLLGIETDEPILTEQALNYSFTNEGGVGNKIRFLKNIMGLWILQRAKLSWENKNFTIDYAAVTNMAKNAEPFQAFFNPDDERFFNPRDMIEELSSFFEESGQKIPEGIGSISRVILENLAFKTAYYLEQLKEFSKTPLDILHIVGGGSKNFLLNQFISNACNIKVVAGPDEGTAAGNIMTQALAADEVNSLSEIREIIKNSYEITEYIPEEGSNWRNNYQSFLKKCKLV